MKFKYRKDKNGNLKDRARIILSTENNSKLKNLIFKKCRDNPLFFFNVFLWTYKPKAVGSEGEPETPHFPFITFNFQDKFILDIIKCIESGQDNITEKSREMGFSWMILGIALWGFLFKGWSGLIGSYKESLVDKAGDMDSAFERLRYMLEKLPSFMKPDDLTHRFANISSKKLGAGIAGDSGDAFGTGGRRKWVFLDEFALWRNDAIAFRKTKDISNCRIIGGTPEGKGNIYGKIMTNHIDYRDIEIKKIRLHWSLHPLKTKSWYEKQKKQRTRLDLAQELDISYDDSVSGAVYEDFDKLVEFKKLDFNSNFKLYSSWDFGRDSNVVQIWQKDFENDKLYLLLSFRRVNRHIRQFASLLVGKTNDSFIYTKDDYEIMKKTSKLFGYYAGHFGDPYNSGAKTTNADQTIKEILYEFGIYLTTKTGTSLESRITKTKLSLNKITIDYDNNIDCIESMRQSRYPNSNSFNETREKTKPIHDENSHHRTAFEYFIDNEPRVLKFFSKKDKNKKFLNRITGEVIKTENNILD